MLTPTFSKETYQDNAPIIIYGAGVCGLLALEGLRLIGLDASFFCDRSSAGAVIEGVKTLHPEALTAYQNAYVLVASSNYYVDIVGYLRSIGHVRYYNVLSLISSSELAAGKTLEEKFAIQNLVNTYLFEVGYKHSTSRVNLFTLDVVITEKCSLKCKDCANAMQYYENPQHCDLQVIKRALDRYLECVDYLPRAFIIGGEPFMNRELHKIIDWYSDHPKVGSIWIFTNGSIIPDRINIEAMKHPKVVVRLSDYGPLVKNLQNFVEMLHRERIPYDRSACDVWQDLGPMCDRHYSLEQIKTVYRTCECRDIFTLLHGKLYHCPWSAHGDNLGIIKHGPNDCIDLMDSSLSDDHIADKIRYLKDGCTHISACGYCNGRGMFAPTIPAAVQRP